MLRVNHLESEGNEHCHMYICCYICSCTLISITICNCGKVCMHARATHCLWACTCAESSVSATQAAQRMCYFLNEITCTAGAEEVIGTSLLQCTQ